VRGQLADDACRAAGRVVSNLSIKARREQFSVNWT